MASDGYRWQGYGASPGTAIGQATIVRTEQDFAGVNEHDILVARHATPALFPSLVRAQAAVCETGGLLNHLAVLARELHKPCVTGLPGIVKALQPGAQLYVDGTRGFVELRSSRQGVPGSGHSLVRPAEVMVPILQFGNFSAAFEHTEAFFDLDMAVRTAALIALPIVLGADSIWEYAVHENKICVAAESLSETTDTIVRQLEDNTLSSKEMHHSYRDLCAWYGWSALANKQIDPQQLYTALCHYITLNQITWVASVAKERFVKRYRTFIFDCFTHVDAVRRESLFLDSLIMPDHSYILQRYLTGRDDNHVWAIALTHDRGSELHRAETAAKVQTLTSGACRQHSSVLQALQSQLSDQDFQRVVCYLSTLSDLVDLTERKNTDLYRCGTVLFGDTISSKALTRLVGISDADRNNCKTEEACRKLIESVLEKLRDWGGPTLGLGVVRR